MDHMCHSITGKFLHQAALVRQHCQAFVAWKLKPLQLGVSAHRLPHASSVSTTISLMSFTFGCEQETPLLLFHQFIFVTILAELSDSVRTDRMERRLAGS
jgi:hypothetical protein